VTDVPVSDVSAPGESVADESVSDVPAPDGSASDVSVRAYLSLRSEVGPRVAQGLHDLLDNGDRAARLVARGRSAFIDDEMLQFAGDSIIAKAGEDVARIDRASPGFIEAHADLELRQVLDTRNYLIYAYEAIDSAILWGVLSEDIPRLAAKLRAFITEASDAV
jgi:uncharacterized protein with HEPN domain